MGLLRKRRTPAVPMWRAQPGLLASPASRVEDDGCASDEAHGVLFRLDGKPGSALIVWAYPVFAGDPRDDFFEPGYCTEYQAGEWIRRQYEMGPGWQHGLDDARQAARGLAEALLGTAHPVGLRHQSLGFDWDGIPW